MAFNVIIVIIALIGAAYGQPGSSTASTPASTTPTTWSDPYAGGKYGNPGARAFVCKKSLDAIHEYVSDMVARAIQGMTVLDLNLPIGFGTLTVKPPRVTEAEFGKHEYQMLPPNRIRSRFFDGRIVANGVWQYKPTLGDLMGGTYKATIKGNEINSTNKLGRSNDARPTVETPECKAVISDFRIEIQGSSQIKVIDSESCKMDKTGICDKIKVFFQDKICELFKAFVREICNRVLQQVPNRMNIQCDQYKVDYGLLSGEPTVNDTDKCIRGGVEGKYIWRTWSGVPFNPPQMEWVNSNRMYSFQISDFTFNTLFHQAHSSGHRFSAAELSSPSTQQLLSLNCDGSAKPTTSTRPSTSTSKPKPTKPSARKFRGPPGPSNVGVAEEGHLPSPKCLGSLLANFSNFGPYSANDLGDIVYKSNPKAPSVLLLSDKRAFFDGGSGSIEFYGPLSTGGNRQLLARAEVRLMRGEFTPKANRANITGTVKITSLQLIQPQSNLRAITSDWLTYAGWFVTPILSESISTFLDRYGQFPLPLPSQYECMSPQFTILPRSMQIDCDVQRAPRIGMRCECLSVGGTCACEDDPKNPKIL